MTVIGPLSEAQCQRLAVLHACHEALGGTGDEEGWRIVRAAHWVCYGEELEVAGFSPETSEVARWRPVPVDLDAVA